MSDKTEKPTQKRLQKARKEGQFAASKQMVGAVQFVVALIALGAWGREWFEGVQAVTAQVFRGAFEGELDTGTLTDVAALIFQQVFLPLIIGGALVFLAPFALHLAMTRFGFSVKPLLPTAEKLNPFSKILRMPKQNAMALLQSTAVLALCGVAAYWLAGRKAEEFYSLPMGSIEAAREALCASFMDLLWDAALVLMLAGAVDFLWERFRFNKQMRMSRQEIRDEYKEVEGNPQIKARVRRMRRDQMRRKMMRQVPQATAVVVNPTHYAVALKYDAEAGGAPRVVAKGCNYLAKRIRTLAETHGVPIVENPPLARTLYKFVGLGEEIPSNLYRAVADVLAYVYKHLETRR